MAPAAASSAPQSNMANNDDIPGGSFVEEAAELKQLIHLIESSAGKADISVFKKAQEICERYQEQPQLLDPLLVDILSPLMTLLQSEAAALNPESLPLVKRLSLVIHSVATVRGPKTVARFFPHMPGDVEPAVALLQLCKDNLGPVTSLRQESLGEWESCCVVLLWLSILALIPFDLAAVDTSLASHPPPSDPSGAAHQGPPLVQQLVGLCREFLASPAAVRDTAALLLSRLLTRPDMRGPLDSFVHWGGEVVAEVLPGGATSSTPGGNTADFLLPGLLAALAAAFKVGGRDVLLVQAPALWARVALPLAASEVAARSPLIRRLRMKLVQRVGLAHLPPRVAMWRYQRGSRSLDHTLGSPPPPPTPDSTAGAASESKGGREEEEEEEEEVPEVIEEVLEELLAGLRDKDTSVRWSAAKGVGRVTARLPAGMGDDVVAAVQALIDPLEGDGAWHGACLALAELARRGLLLPSRLPQTVPLVIQALHYDVPRGAHSVGAHVRDAAAYVCWAFARAYSPAVMASPFQTLAPSLLTAACYDREVNCRRAAAAAFQENVGRQQTFPHGIEIVTAADFGALGPLGHAYRQVACQVARYEEYRAAMVDELIRVKIRHWSAAVRELAAEGLGRLAPMDPTHFSAAVVDHLVPATCAADLALRHGATLALAHVLPALHKMDALLAEERQVAVRGVIPGIEAAKLYRGRGGELMRTAVCHLAHSLAVIRMALTPAERDELLATLEDHLSQALPDVQVAAAEALGAYARAYEMLAEPGRVERVTGRQVSLLKDSPHAPSTRGAALALGHLPAQLLQPMWHHVIAAVCRAATESADAETRVNAVRALPAICRALLPEKEAVSTHSADAFSVQVIRGPVLSCLLTAVEDYASDHRGDVGSLVREASMEALVDCVHHLATAQPARWKHDRSSPSPEAHPPLSSSNAMEEAEGGVGGVGEEERLEGRVVAALCKQGMEKIDRTRGVGGRCLERLLWGWGEGMAIRVPHRKLLEKMVPRGEVPDWTIPGCIIPRLLPLLAWPEYRPALLAGLVISVGGIAETLSKVATSALLKFLHSPSAALAEAHAKGGGGGEVGRGGGFGIEFDEGVVVAVGAELAKMLTCHSHVDRVVVPTLKTIVKVLGDPSAEILKTPANDIGPLITSQVAAELRSPPCKDVPKLMAAVDALCQLAVWPGPTCQLALKELVSLLKNRYPKVRQYCAEQVYLQLMVTDSDFFVGTTTAGDDDVIEDHDDVIGDHDDEEASSSLDTILELLSATPWSEALKESAEALRKLEVLLVPSPK